MTIQQLIEQLEDASNDLGPNTPVRLALQPNYPMLGSIENICVDRSTSTPRILIACSNHEDYGCPRDAWTESEIEADND